MHFNTKVGFTRVEFRRDEKTGVYKHLGQPWDVDYTKVEGYSHGEISLDNGTTVLVEEDYDQIKHIMDTKEMEKEEYDDHLRKLEMLGMAAMPGAEE